MDEATIEASRVPKGLRAAPDRAALMFAMAGVLAIVGTYTAAAHDANLWLLRALAVGDLGLGALIYLLPWERWPAKCLLAIPIVSLAMIGVFEAAGALTPYTYPVFFILVFIWIGLFLPPRSSFLFAPLSTIAYLFPVWGELDAVGARDSALVVLPVCWLIAEVISRAVASVRAARGGMERLLGVSRALTDVSTTQEATDLLASLASELLNADAALVFLTDPASPRRLVASAWCDVPAAVEGLVIDIDTEQSGMGMAIDRAATFFMSERVADRMHPGLQRITRAEAGVFFPLAGQSGYVGAITVVWTKPKKELDSFARQAIELLSLMAGRIVDRLRATARLSREAERDDLTGLLNRRSFHPLLEASEPGDAIVLVDLDRFKGVNDRFGHGAGDKVLLSLGQCMEAAVREGDEAARLGGEEFALLLSKGGEGGAAAAVERLRTLWDKTNPLTTFSAGIAVKRANETVGETLRRADAALYAAKNAGRNRTEISLVSVL